MPFSLLQQAEVERTDALFSVMFTPAWPDRLTPRMPAERVKAGSPELPTARSLEGKEALPGPKYSRLLSAQCPSPSPRRSKPHGQSMRKIRRIKVMLPRLRQKTSVSDAAPGQPGEGFHKPDAHTNEREGAGAGGIRAWRRS